MNKKIVLLSEMRVGSTWLIRLLSSILNRPHTGVANIAECRKNLDQGYIQKLHNWNYIKLFDTLKPNDYKIVTIVRNPRDSATSLAYYRRSRHSHITNVTDEAHRLCTQTQIIQRQFERMVLGHSTASKNYESDYIWTTYEWMKKNTYLELSRVLNFLNFQATDADVRSCVEKTQRRYAPLKGNERDYRKGIVGDWENVLSQETVLVTEHNQAKYFKLLEIELNGRK